MDVPREIFKPNVRKQASDESMAPRMERSETSGTAAKGSICSKSYYSRGTRASSYNHFDIYEAYKNTPKLKTDRALWLWDKLAVKGSAPNTLPQELAKRGTFMLICIMTLCCSLLWSTMFYVLDRHAAMMCPLGYYVAVSGAMATLASEGSYENFVVIQLALIFLLPYGVHLVLGGLEASGGVMIWSFLAPLGAAFFRSAKESVQWFKAFICCSVSLLAYDMYHVNTTHDSLEHLFYFAMDIIGVMTIVFAGTFFFARALEEEYARSEALLHNMMPPTIARRIKAGENPIIDKHGKVSLLFADVVGFTKAAATMSSDLVIEQFLQDFFHLTDQAVELRKLTKIKTIGDAYMVVGGIEENGPEEHVSELLHLAGDMLDIVDAVNGNCGTNFEIRLGMHVGPVIAGVLGVKRFAFDVWGDAVNTASRMESHGKPGHIHLTEKAYEAVKDKCSEDFDFEWNGETEIKSKGRMLTFFAKPKELGVGDDDFPLEMDYSDGRQVVEGDAVNVTIPTSTRTRRLSDLLSKLKFKKKKGAKQQKDKREIMKAMSRARRERCFQEVSELDMSHNLDDSAQRFVFDPNQAGSTKAIVGVRSSTKTNDPHCLRPSASSPRSLKSKIPIRGGVSFSS